MATACVASIWMAARHPDDPDLTLHGHSIGHWEGDVLVVDTAAIAPQAYIAISEAVGIPNDGDMHIVERLHLAKPNVLHDDLEITAPKVLTGNLENHPHFSPLSRPSLRDHRRRMRAGRPRSREGSVRQRHIRSPAAKPGRFGPRSEIRIEAVSLKKILLAAGLLMSLSGAAFAHHSGAAYDAEHPQTLEGTVKTVNWTNPHITFVIEADAKDGKPAQTWVFEVSSPGVLTQVWLDQAFAAARRSRDFSLRAASRRQDWRVPDESESAGRQGTELQSYTCRSVTS